MLDETLYEKCGRCHLFVEPNDAHSSDASVAAFVHMHRGDEADRATDASHQAAPSGMLATLSVWKVYGPRKMRERFRFTDQEEGKRHG